MAKCLIADDSKVIRMILSKIMRNLKYDIIEAEDGEEVVELCETEEPDLIIMDTKLPILEGLDAMYKIREMQRIKQPKIIFCSSVTDPMRIREALDGGADDYIMKPFDEEIILSKLEILNLV